jgi:hypothetical protein
MIYKSGSGKSLYVANCNIEPNETMREGLLQRQEHALSRLDCHIIVSVTTSELPAASALPIFMGSTLLNRQYTSRLKAPTAVNMSLGALRAAVDIWVNIYIRIVIVVNI